MDLQKKVQDVLDRAVENGTECGCQAALFIDGKLEVNAYAGASSVRDGKARSGRPGS